MKGASIVISWTRLYVWEIKHTIRCSISRYAYTDLLLFNFSFYFPGNEIRLLDSLPGRNVLSKQRILFYSILYSIRTMIIMIACMLIVLCFIYSDTLLYITKAPIIVSHAGNSVDYSLIICGPTTLIWKYGINRVNWYFTCVKFHCNYESINTVDYTFYSHSRWGKDLAQNVTINGQEVSSYI